MTRILLIRHAAHDWLEKCLVGRMANIPINQTGREQSRFLADALQVLEVDVLYSSPMLRAVQTAKSLAESWGLRMQIAEDFNEIDFGTWTGSLFAELARDAAWEVWNCERATARTPGGESMREVQRRAIAGLERIYAVYPGQTVAVVSHGDVLKSIIAFYEGLSLDLLQTLHMEPASVAVLVHEGINKKILLQNGDGNSVLGILHSAHCVS